MFGWSPSFRLQNHTEMNDKGIEKKNWLSIRADREMGAF